MTRASLYVAFLYGVNIPGGRRFTRDQVSSDLRCLQPALMFAAIVSTAGSREGRFLPLRCVEHP